MHNLKDSWRYQLQNPIKVHIKNIYELDTILNYYYDHIPIVITVLFKVISEIKLKISGKLEKINYTSWNFKIHTDELQSTVK